ncbi:MAG: hypothetical protein JW857_08000 [Bacteroidales bacterium]|nr:hypothetical protein [Bacteroidales bacterium]
MNQTLKFSLFLMLIFFQSCTDFGCEDNLCFSPPQAFYFELVDSSTGENLFTNGTYKSDAIEIINEIDSTQIDFSFISENALNCIQIASIGWESEIVEGILSINNTEIFRFYVDAKRVNENCCSFTRYDEFRIENAVYEYDYQTGVYKIQLATDNSDCIDGEADHISSADHILGQWKLIREKTAWLEASTYNYTNDTIIYNFQSDGNLIVTGNPYTNRAYANGSYTYVFEKEDAGGADYPEIWSVKIRSLSYTYKSKANRMELGLSYVDGSDYCFEKTDDQK